MNLASMGIASRGSIRRRWARHIAALAFFCAMAVLHTWPLASSPATLSRHDNGDALLNEWIVAWVQHQLPRDPLHLFDANIFYPEPNTLAFSEHLFVQSVIGMPLAWSGLSTTAVHNLLVIIGLALTGWATYLLMIRWTGDVLAALSSGCLMAFNAHTLVRLAHLQAMHVEFLPFALLALHELLERPRVGAALAVGLFFALQGLTSNYLLVFTVFALAAAGLARPGDWWGPRMRRLAGPLALSAAAGILLMLPFLLPYGWAQREQGFSRSLVEIELRSASWRDYLATGGRLHYELWAGPLWSGPVTPLFPGLVSTALALVAVGSGLAFRDRRARMWVAVGVAGVVLSFGPAVPGYLTLFRFFPLLQGIRAPVRIGFLFLAAVAVLAGFGLMWLRQRWALRPRMAALVGMAAIALVTVEAVRAPIGLTPARPVPSVYRALALEPRAVVAEYPMHAPVAIALNAEYMLYSTRHWKPMVNGYSGFLPASYRDNWPRLNAFPEPAALESLVTLGVTHVVVHGPGRIAAAERVRGLVRVVSTPEVAIYRLDRTAIEDARSLRR